MRSKAFKIEIVRLVESGKSSGKETGASESTLHDQARQFEQEGMASLFPKERAPQTPTGRSLPALTSGRRAHHITRPETANAGRIFQRVLGEQTATWTEGTHSNCISGFRAGTGEGGENRT